MTTENVNPEIDFSDEAVAAVIEGDDHLRTLPLDSEDLKAAVAEKMATMTGEDDAPAGDEGNEDDSDDADEAPEEKTENVKKPQKGWAKRVEKLVVQNHEKERRIRELEDRLQEQEKTIVNQAVGEFEYDKPEPVFDDFNTIAEYSKAVARWEYGRIEAEKAHVAEVQQVSQRVQEVKSSWEAKQEEARAAFDDFDSIVTIDSVTDANPSQQAKEFLADSDFGPVVIYTLLSNDELAEEFKNASPTKQVRLLSKLEIALEETKPTTAKSEAAATKKPMKLPGSLPKGRPTAQGIDIIRDADKMSDAEWSKAFETQRRVR